MLPAYRFLPGWEKIQRLPENSVRLDGDLLVVLDASDKGRIGRRRIPGRAIAEY